MKRRTRFQKDPVLVAAARDLDDSFASGKAQINRLRKQTKFVEELARVEAELRHLKAEYPADMEEFFNKATFAKALDSIKTQQLLDQCSNRDVRTVLSRYLSFVRKFHVWLQPGRRRSFRLFAPLSGYHTFRAEVRNSRLVPLDNPEGEVVYSEQFGAPKMELPKKLRKLVEAGRVRWVDVTFDDGTSLLEDFRRLHTPENLTFVSVRGEEPLLLCIVGREISTESVWKPAASVITEFHKKLYGSSLAGRKPNMKRRKQAVMLQTKPGSVGEKAQKLLPKPNSQNDLDANTRYLHRTTKRLSPNSEENHKNMPHAEIPSEIK